MKGPAQPLEWPQPPLSGFEKQEGRIPACAKGREPWWARGWRDKGSRGGRGCYWKHISTVTTHTCIHCPLPWTPSLYLLSLDLRTKSPHTLARSEALMGAGQRKEAKNQHHTVSFL